MGVVGSFLFGDGNGGLCPARSAGVFLTGNVIAYGNLFITSQGGSGGGAGAFVSSVGIATAAGGTGGGVIEVTTTNGVNVAGMTLNGNHGGGAGMSGSGGGAGDSIPLYGLNGSGVSASGT